MNPPPVLSGEWVAPESTIPGIHPRNVEQGQLTPRRVDGDVHAYSRRRLWQNANLQNIIHRSDDSSSVCSFVVYIF